MPQVQLPSRVADYFFLVGVNPQDAQLDSEEGDHGLRNKLNLVAKILDKFPQKDFPDAEAPKDSFMFCFPNGVQLHMGPKAAESFCFVQTEADGSRVYGSALTVYEPVRKLVDGEDIANVVHLPKVLLITSHWPFYTQFKRFLAELYDNAITGKLQCPIERILTNFIFEVPLPPPGRLEVVCRSLSTPRIFARPPPNRMPLRDFALTKLLRIMSVDTILVVYAAILCELKIMFTSSNYGALTLCSETMCYFLFPYFWRHIYIPVLPQRLLDFICAPMPYMVGLHSSYMPDAFMLEGVVVVDLDTSVVRASDSTEIPELPSKRFNELAARLRKQVGDTSKPIARSAKLAEQEIEEAFLDFHVKLFKSYREYLEAPSEFVVDKFNKQKFVAESPYKCPWLTAFVETQMFQCFVDDRYVQQTSKAQNLEVLFFDESIDAAQGKHTPFLSDTSQNHSEQDRVLAMFPTKDGLAASTFKYDEWPLALNQDTLPPREVKPLSVDTALHKMDMSKLNLKFFTEKRLYSQHFHMLKVRSTKQDLAFQDILHYFKRSQALDEYYVGELDKLCAATVDKNTIETCTSVDGPWRALRKLVADQADTANRAYHIWREDVCAPLDATTSVVEHHLKLFFREASILEQKAGQGKAAVERAKARANALKAKHAQMRRAFYNSPTQSPADIAKMVQAQSEAEDASLDTDEAETSFHHIVDEYEKRMPELITLIRKLNRRRIDQLKASLTKWCEAQRHTLTTLTKDLDELEDQVKLIDGKKDIIALSEGTTDFWQMGSTLQAIEAPTVKKRQIVSAKGAKPASSGPPPSSSSSSSAASSSASSAASSSSSSASASSDALSGLPNSSSDSLIDRGSSVIFIKSGLSAALGGSNSSSLLLLNNNNSSSDVTATATATAPMTIATSTSPRINTGLALQTHGIFPSHTSMQSQSLLHSQRQPQLVSGDHDPESSKGGGVGGLGSDDSIDPTSPGRIGPPAASDDDLEGEGEHEQGQVDNTQDGGVEPSQTMDGGNDNDMGIVISESADLLSDVDAPDSARKSVAMDSFHEMANVVCYPLKLWGQPGFAAALEQANSTKVAMKDLFTCLEEWATLQDNTSKKYVGLVKSTPRDIFTLKTQQAMWMIFQKRILARAKCNTEFSSLLTKLSVDLRLVRGQLKHSMRRYTEHKIRLEKEVQASAEALAKATERRNKAKAAFAATESTALKGRGNGPAMVSQQEMFKLRVDKVGREMKEAEHELALAVRDRKAVQRKHDVCVGRILGLFEIRERDCGLALKKVLSVLVDCVKNYMVLSPEKWNEELRKIITDVNIEVDLREFLESTYSQDTPQHQRIKPEATVNLGDHLGWAGWGFALKYCNLCVNSLGGLVDFTDTTAAIEDFEVKGLKKIPAIIRCSSMQSLQGAFATMAQILERIATDTEADHLKLKQLSKALAAEQAELKKELKQHETLYTEQEKLVKRANDDKDKAEAALSAAQQALSQAHTKVMKAEEDDKKDNKGKISLLAKVMGTQVEVLKQKEESATKDLEKQRKALADATQALAEVSSTREENVVFYLQEIQLRDRKRAAAVHKLVLKALSDYRSNLNRFNDHVGIWGKRVNGVDYDQDMHKWIVLRASGVAPPQSVVWDSHQNANGVYSIMKLKLRKEEGKQDKRSDTTLQGKMVAFSGDPKIDSSVGHGGGSSGLNSVDGIVVGSGGGGGAGISGGINNNNGGPGGGTDPSSQIGSQFSQRFSQSSHIRPGDGQGDGQLDGLIGDSMMGDNNIGNGGGGEGDNPDAILSADSIPLFPESIDRKGRTSIEFEPTRAASASRANLSTEINLSPPTELSPSDGAQNRGVAGGKLSADESWDSLPVRSRAVDE